MTEIIELMEVEVVVDSSLLWRSTTEMAVACGDAKYLVKTNCVMLWVKTSYVLHPMMAGYFYSPSYLTDELLKDLTGGFRWRVHLEVLLMVMLMLKAVGRVITQARKNNIVIGMCGTATA